MARLGKALVLLALLVTAMPLTAESRKIAVLGDSLVAGYGLPEEAGLIPVTQAWLDAAGEEITLINAGVSGDTTAGGLSRLDWTLSDDVDALVVALGGNDVLRGIDPATSRANLHAILVGASAKGLPVLLVAAPAPGNFGEAYKAEFEAIFPELAVEFDVMLYPGFLPALVKGAITQDDLNRYFQADAIHPNAEGVKKIVDNFAPVVRDFANTKVKAGF